MRILLSNEIFSYPDQWIPAGWAYSDSRPEGSAHGRGYGQGEMDDGRGATDGGDARMAMANRMPAWKRYMDIVGACAGIVLLSPLFLAVSAFIRIVSPGPVFYRQERMGYGGKPFTMTKFRTMKAGVDGEHRKERLVSKVRFDQVPGRPEDDAGQWIIPGGRFIRSSRIDELPLLFNVLKGRMSLVGPKPCLPWEAEEYRWWHARRFDILPGMTGLWRANGTERLTFLQRIRLDIAYARRVTVMGDVRILLRSLPAVAGMAGIRPAGESGKRPVTAIPGTKSAV